MEHIKNIIFHVLEALENDTIAGAGLDVQENEPPEEAKGHQADIENALFKISLMGISLLFHYTNQIHHLDRTHSAFIPLISGLTACALDCLFNIVCRKDTKHNRNFAL